MLGLQRFLLCTLLRKLLCHSIALRLSLLELRSRLIQELLRDPAGLGCCGDKKRPKLLAKGGCGALEEACEVYLQHAWIELLFPDSLLENVRDQHFVFGAVHELCKASGDPRLHCVPIYSAEIHLLSKLRWKFHGFQQLLFLVGEPDILLGCYSSICHT
jgi:hypothetical protein